MLSADGAARAAHMAHKVAREVPVRVPTIDFTQVSWQRDIASLEKDLGSLLTRFEHKEATSTVLQLNKAKWHVQEKQWKDAAMSARAGLDIKHPAYSDSTMQDRVGRVRCELALLLAYARNQRKNWSNAVKAVELVPSRQLSGQMGFDLLVQKAFALCQEGELDDALAVCDKAIALYPFVTRSKAYAIKAHLHNEKGERNDSVN